MSTEVLNGAFVSYHDNGNISEKGTYIDGMLQGVFHEYDEDGKLIVQSKWKDHKLHGKLTRWRDVNTGVLSETSIYSNNVCTYTCLFDQLSRISANYFYDENGVCTKSIEYKRTPNGFTIIATTTSNPKSYTEEIIKTA